VCEARREALVAKYESQKQSFECINPELDHGDVCGWRHTVSSKLQANAPQEMEPREYSIQDVETHEIRPITT
jgi:hypothetical protein